MTRHGMRRVLAAQNISHNCLACGTHNDHGLHGRFYQLAARDEDGDAPAGPELLGVFTPRQEHQGYPGRLHGGIAAAILDETIGRAILLLHDDEWGVTGELTVRFRHPLPLDGEIRCVARITRDTRRLFEGTGDIVLADGTVAATARGKYLKMPIGAIADDFDGSEWIADPRERPEWVDL
jgi:acyl-coenzyme A thioesterase PaaI-like protein